MANGTTSKQINDTTPLATITTPSQVLPASGEFVLDANGLPVTHWWLYVGTGVQGFDLLSEGFQETTPDNPRRIQYVNFPTDGSVIHTTLFWRLEGESASDWTLSRVSLSRSQ